MQMSYEVAFETQWLMTVGEWDFCNKLYPASDIPIQGKGVVFERPNGIHFYIDRSILNGRTGLGCFCDDF